MQKLSDIGTIKNILARHGFSFSKSMGQNFLINPSVCPRMALECANDNVNGVLEIGPGIGVLTCELASSFKKVVSVELDKRLLPVLDETLSDFNNIKIINEDILKLDIKKLIDDEFNGEKIAVCANLPYYITSPVIMKLLENKLPISSLTVMVQKEAADRICAEPGSRQSGAISAAIRYYSTPKMLFKVSSGSFMPSPKVDSCVIKLDVLDKPPVCVCDEKLFFNVVKAGFSQRRKNILNSLSSGLNLTKDQVSKLLTDLEISTNLRAEQLTLEQFSQISNKVKEIM